MSIILEIKKTLKCALPDSEIYILDPRNDQTHLEAIVISPLFINLSLVKQHRIVMQPLNEHFKEGLHALALKTYTPDEWKKRQKDGD
ncbi:MAG: Acid stress protein IbaG [Chlamydiae bacterium]|nr:Acid stress protein IbaG [Chlamydiota bacterium]